jgi:hypothetical protein
MVMENLLARYEKLSQLDLKVGYTIEPDVGVQGWEKTIRKNLVDMTTPTWTEKEKMASKMLSPYTIFDGFAKGLPESSRDKQLQAWGDRLAEMALWWHKQGKGELRSIAASLLFVYEGQPQNGSHADFVTPPTLKFIDYAHFYVRGPAQRRPCGQLAGGRGLHRGVRLLQEVPSEVPQSSDGPGAAPLREPGRKARPALLVVALQPGVPRVQPDGGPRQQASSAA